MLGRIHQDWIQVSASKMFLFFSRSDARTHAIATKSVLWVSRARIFWEDGPLRTLSVNSWEAGGL